MKNDELDREVNIDKELNILHDGKQFMVKIPKEVSEFLKIEKGDKFRFIIDMPEDPGEKPKLNFEVIKNS